jgi:hypothetical protein
MTFINVEFSNRRVRNGVAQPQTTTLTPEPVRAAAALRDALASVMAIDRSTAWPMHRIRCFLLAEQLAATAPATR